MFTYFWDMHSGGDRKLAWNLIAIEADEATARQFFEDTYGRDPDNVTCPCCGPDYIVETEDTRAELDAFVAEYFQGDPVLVITAAELPDWQDADDGQPDEAREWHDYDPDC